MSDQFNILVKTYHGLEQILAEEIKAIGGESIQVLTRAVMFTGNTKALYRANYECRTAIRVLKFLKEDTIRNENDLYKLVSTINWESYMSVHDTLSIDAVTNSEIFTHNKFVALKTKDAIVDQFRKKYDERPSVNTQDPDLRIYIHIREDTCSIYLDSSGDSLHKRGYREGNFRAPLSECLAAGMIMLSGWDGKSDFHDPMCGSGTLLIEAAMIAKKIPAGYFRRAFAFENWKAYDNDLFEAILDAADNQIIETNLPLIQGSDEDSEALNITERNIESTELQGVITLKKCSIAELTNSSEKGILVTNPPYDKRIQSNDIEALYAELGDLFKKQYSGWKAWVISSNMPALKRVGLRPSRKIGLFNGPDECKFQQYEMYAGSKKAKKQNPPVA
ncbi:MAG: class I SAM-dependent RNA methyltransferase [Cyclobacteriaceae bacterium]